MPRARPADVRDGGRWSARGGGQGPRRGAPWCLPARLNQCGGSRGLPSASSSRGALAQGVSHRPHVAGMLGMASGRHPARSRGRKEGNAFRSAAAVEGTGGSELRAVSHHPRRCGWPEPPSGWQRPGRRCARPGRGDGPHPSLPGRPSRPVADGQDGLPGRVERRGNGPGRLPQNSRPWGGPHRHAGGGRSRSRRAPTRRPRPGRPGKDKASRRLVFAGLPLAPTRATGSRPPNRGRELVIIAEIGQPPTGARPARPRCGGISERPGAGLRRPGGRKKGVGVWRACAVIPASASARRGALSSAAVPRTRVGCEPRIRHQGRRASGSDDLLCDVE